MGFEKIIKYLVQIYTFVSKSMPDYFKKASQNGPLDLL